MTKIFVTRTFSDKHIMTKPCLLPNNSDDKMKRWGDESCLSPNTIFLVKHKILLDLKNH